jgi:hypothetical protein
MNRIATFRVGTVSEVEPRGLFEGSVALGSPSSSWPLRLKSA